MIITLNQHLAPHSVRVKKKKNIFIDQDHMKILN